MTKIAEDEVSLYVLSGFSSYRQQKVYTDNHSGISARQRDSKVSMTDLVSAEDYVNHRVSTGLSVAIDEGRRRRR